MAHCLLNNNEDCHKYHLANWQLISMEEYEGLGVPSLRELTLWLLSNNRLLTYRDNLGKKRKLEDSSCLFRSDSESINHQFFECVVAKRAWNIIYVVFRFKSRKQF
jgi:hypothetical protein